MHGRVKVRTTEQEAERKRKEQAIKLELYQKTMSKILGKRAAGQYDDELMELTAKVLSQNPDVFTLWNIRREYLLQRKADNPEAAEEKLKKELTLTKNCLETNPKSYNAWHHRCWTLENMATPNWENEVKLCTTYLHSDERNFHVWDYRRYAAAQAKIDPQKEFDYCKEKIEKNFSNYSAWHQRSKLLPLLHPHRTDKSRPIDEEALGEELGNVLSAVFTDPKDSSAWFYQRWLLGDTTQELDIAAFKLTKSYALITFTRPVNLHKCSVSLDAATKFDTSKWKPVQGQTHIHHYAVWKLEDSFVLNSEGGSQYDLTFVHENNETYTLPITKSVDGLFGIKMPRLGFHFGAAVLDVLQEQLLSCQQLLEYDPDSKWALKIAALLMRAIDRKRYHAESLELIEKLAEYDPCRRGYYRDLSNKWNIEDRLEDWIIALRTDREAPIDLSHLDLIGMHYKQYVCVADVVNLIGNRFNAKRHAEIAGFMADCNVEYTLDSIEEH